VTEDREDDPDLLRDLANNLMDKAERCYRLARGTVDFKVRERLLEIAHEFELEAEDGRARARR
jgi:hypothetical protein